MNPLLMPVLNLIYRLRERLVGAAGAVGLLGALYTSELFYNHVDGVIYAGKGNDGNGKATSIVAVAGAAKADAVHSHAVAEIAGLAALLDGKPNQQWVVDSLNTKADLSLVQGQFAQLGVAIANEQTRATTAELAAKAAADNALAVASGKADKATTLAGYGITDTFTKAEVIAREALINGVDADQAAALASFSIALATQGTAEQNHAAALLANIAAEVTRAKAAEADAKATADAAKATADAAQTAAQVQAAIVAAFAQITVISGGQL
jgi:hypothetical protein